MRDSFSNSIAENQNELNRWLIDSAQIFELNRVPWAESIWAESIWAESIWAESIQLISIWAESIQLISIWAESIQLMGLNDRSSENIFLSTKQQQQQQRFDSIPSNIPVDNGTPSNTQTL
jgi:hypothetical protein